MIKKICWLAKTVLTWWNGATVGTHWYTKRCGVRVGDDSQGNTYYRDARDRRRWVMFNGLAEASRVPPLWDAWLHFTLQHAPQTGTDGAYKARLPHNANLTGTALAYTPDGAIEKNGHRAPTKSDYQAWAPQGDAQP